MATFVEKKKLWKAKVSLGKIKGKYKYRYFYAKTEALAEKKADDFFNELKRNPTFAGISFQEWIEEWLLIQEDRVKMKKIEPRTLDDYKSTIKNHVLIHFGICKKALTDLSASDIRTILSPVLGKRTGEKTYTLVKACLNKAKADNIITYNPCDSEEKPSYDKKVRKVISERAFILFLNTLKDIRYQFAFLFEYESGLRPQEVCGIKKEDITFKQAYGEVKRALSFSKEEGFYWNEGKSHNACRFFSLPVDFALQLEEHTKHMQNTDFVIENKFRGHESTNNLGNVFSKTRDRILKSPFVDESIKEELIDTSQYCLRHTFATNVIAVSNDYNSIKEQMGHHSIDFTIKNYVHPVFKGNQDIHKNSIASKITLAGSKKVKKMLTIA